MAHLTLSKIGHDKDRKQVYTNVAHVRVFNTATLITFAERVVEKFWIRKTRGVY